MFSKTKLKGQAFDTMMLVISVIVAVVILGVLLSFLKIDPPGQDASNVMASNLASISNVGYGNKGPIKITFLEGSFIDVTQVIGSTPIYEKQVIFKCDSICGSNGPLELRLSGKAVKANKNYQGYLAVCSNGKGSDNSYVLQISNDQDAVVEKCIENLPK